MTAIFFPTAHDTQPEPFSLLGAIQYPHIRRLLFHINHFHHLHSIATSTPADAPKHNVPLTLRLCRYLPTPRASSPASPTSLLSRPSRSMRPGPGNVPFRSSTTAITGTAIVTTARGTVQSGECPNKQLAHSWQAGANYGDVVFHGGPKNYGIEALGCVGRELGGEEKSKTDYGDHYVAGRILATNPGKRVKKP